MIKINFLGDLNFGENNFSCDPFIDISEILKNASLNVVNLEGPLLDKRLKHLKKAAPIFSNSSNIEWMVKNKINVACLANNHIFDFKEEGFKNTITILLKNRIDYFGSGINLSNAISPLIKEINGVNIGFLGFSWDVIQSINAKKNKAGTASLYKKIILNTIKKNKSLFDFLVVSLHFNYEYEQWPLPSQRKLCHEIIDNGTDIIICHHPHIFQGVEIYKDKLIAYSLGNFFFSNIMSKIGKELREWSKETKYSIILKIKLLQDLSYKYEVIPIYTDKDWQLKFIINEEKTKILERIKFLSLPFLGDDQNYRSFWKKNRTRVLPDHFTDFIFIQKIAIILHKIREKIKGNYSK